MASSGEVRVSLIALHAPAGIGASVCGLFAIAVGALADALGCVVRAFHSDDRIIGWAVNHPPPETHGDSELISLTPIFVVAGSNVQNHVQVLL